MKFSESRFKLTGPREPYRRKPGNWKRPEDFPEYVSTMRWMFDYRGSIPFVKKMQNQYRYDSLSYNQVKALFRIKQEHET
jgi:hypothetical protein